MHAFTKLQLPIRQSIPTPKRKFLYKGYRQLLVGKAMYDKESEKYLSDLTWEINHPEMKILNQLTKSKFNTELGLITTKGTIAGIKCEREDKMPSEHLINKMTELIESTQERTMNELKAQIELATIENENLKLRTELEKRK